MSRLYKIAVIDDDEVFQLIIKKQLEMRNFSCEILRFSNGQESINFLKDNIQYSEKLPQLIMLDVNMPIKDGWEFLEEYKHLPFDTKKSIMLYMVTSSVIQTDIDRAAKNEDIHSFISKPITNQNLDEILMHFSTVN
ncbi:response regulator [Reichenbachiella sp. MALMAid0571]|uniref:response regulator n=1 Tax=Reichenbachiella sp. MALMAid0571 TaxID=3143939 RepID=UPI0032E04CF7